MTIRLPRRARPRPSLPDFTPVPRRYRHDGWTPERQRGFIEALADTGSVRAAAERVGMANENAYVLRRARGGEGFAAAWQVALDHAIRRLEDSALERAIHGDEVPVYSYGKLVGTRRVYNDRLIMFMLRNRAPMRFTPVTTMQGMPKREENQGPNSPDAIARVEMVLAEIRHRRALDASNPRGPITIRGDEREAYEAWKRARDSTTLSDSGQDDEGRRDSESCDGTADRASSK